MYYVLAVTGRKRETGLDSGHARLAKVCPLLIKGSQWNRFVGFVKISEVEGGNIRQGRGGIWCFLHLFQAFGGSLDLL